MKKKEETTTEVALANPAVRSNINLNLDQNDMIQLVIQDRLEQLEKEIELFPRALAEIEEESRVFIAGFKLACIKRHFKGDKEFDKMKELSEMLGADLNTNISLDSGYRGDFDKTKIGVYRKIDLNKMEDYKDPYAYARRNIQDEDMCIITPKKITGSMSIQAGNIFIKLDVKENNALTPAEKKQYKEGITPYVTRKMQMLNLQYETGMKYLECKYGEKRIKSKIVKASLQKSDEGRGILTMLETATNIKLLA